jgi:tetratricopeptide (TPR) repeat protein
MTPERNEAERHEAVSQLFHAALELPAAERTAYLNRVCEGDDELFEDVTSLLQLEESSQDLPDWTVMLPLAGQSPEPDGQRLKYCPLCRLQCPLAWRVCPADGQRLSLPDPYHLVGQTLAGKFRIEALIGIGGMGAVYSALHLGIERRVAFKILQPNVALENRRMESLFEREAKLAGHLHHDNIADITDAGRTAEGIAYLVMEWLDGHTLDEELLAAPLGLARATDILRQIAAALDAAHTRNIVHCDLKPSNIMLLPGECNRLRVKVLDFGIAKLLHNAAPSRVSAAMGTPHYASPEQFQVGGLVDARSDVYSLGVILYQMLTGRLPFNASSVYELARLQQTPPAPAHQLRPELPSGIGRLVNQMLAREPADRPGRIREVVEAFESLLENRAAVSEPDEATDGEREAATPILVRAVLPPVEAAKRRAVGRDAARAKLQQAFEAARAGRGLLVCVTGEAGIGKTTVVEEFLRQVCPGGRDCAVARGRCPERLEGAGAYLPMLEAIEDLLRGPQGRFYAGLLQLSAPTWHAQIAPRAASAAEPLEQKAVSREQMKRELRAFIQDAAGHGPLVLTLDDLHWSDVSTIDLLAFLGAKFDSTRLLIVATYRPTELLLSNHSFLQVKLDMQARGDCQEIALGFFHRGEIELYLEREFPGHAFPPEFSAFLLEKTEGSPLFVADLLRYLRDRDVIAETGGQWSQWKLTEAIPEIGPALPASVDGMIQRKINQLSDGQRRLLAAASVQGCEFDSAVLAKTLGMVAPEVEDLLESLETVHAFLRLVGEQEFPDGTLTLRYRFVHSLYQSVFYNGLTPTKRRALSAAVAAALLQHYGDQAATIAPSLALLLETGRQYSRAADYFLISARSASNLFAYREAMALANRGLKLLAQAPPSPDRDRREMELQTTLGLSLIAIHGYAAPQVETVFTRARELCLQTEASPLLYPVLRGLSLFYNNLPRLDTAREIGEQLLQLTGEQHGPADPGIALEALFSLGSTLFFMGEFESSLAHAERAIALDRPRSQYAGGLLYEQNATAGCLVVASLNLWALGFPDRALARSREALALSEQLGQPFNLARALAWASLLHLFRREWALCQQRAEEAVRYAEQYEFRYWQALGAIYKGYALYKQDGSGQGIELMRAGLKAEHATGAHIGRPLFLALLGEVLGLEGAGEEGLALLDDAIAVLDATPEHAAYADIYRLKGELLLREPSRSSAQGVELEAANCFRRATEQARRTKARSLELRAVTGWSRLLLREGKRDEARRMLAEIRGWFREGLDTPDVRDADALLNELA